MNSSEVDSRSIALSMRKSVENLVISSQDAIGQSISQALSFAQHTNQILQDTRSVSRSPSPSLRNPANNIIIEQLENDKSDLSFSVPEYQGNSVSDFSITVKDAIKSTAPTPPKSTEGRSKKKSWYSALYPTYKSRSEDFKRLFKDLPDEERLIVDYSCALQKDILLQGRLYASQHYLCFYANIFGWETHLALRWKDVTAITKEKTALVIPNAILVCTEAEKHFLSSLTSRDKSYLMLFRVWQNALMDQPMTSQEIWQWVHSCYGEELGFNSDDEGYARDLDDDKPLAALQTDEFLESSMLEAGSGEESREEPRLRRPPLPENGNEPAAPDALPTDVSDTTDSDHDDAALNNGEPCEKCTSPHDGKLLLQHQFSISIDQLFTMMFTNSKQFLQLLAERNARDYVQDSWKPNAETKLECRQISYTLGLTSGPIGPKEVHVTEMQVMNPCSKPGVQYSIDCSSENAGIPYADYFTVNAHYCLQRVTDSQTMLLMYAQIKYKKSMMSFIKTFLEKNAMGGVEEFARLLLARLQREGLGAPARKGRRRRHPLSAPAALPLPPPSPPSPSAAAPRPWRWPLLLLLLVLVNGLLYWTLWTADRHRHDFSLDELQNMMNSLKGSQLSEWSAMLERDSLQQKSINRALRDDINRVISHLTQTEQAVAKLMETMQPALAPPDDHPRDDL